MNNHDNNSYDYSEKNAEQNDSSLGETKELNGISDGYKIYNNDNNMSGESNQENPAINSNISILNFSNNNNKKKKKRNKKGRNIMLSLILVSIILGVAVLLSYAIIKYSADVFGMTGSETKKTITIPEGSSTEDIAQLLKDEHIIDYPDVFIGFCKLVNSDDVFNAGYHEFKDAMSYKDIIEELTTSNTKMETVRIMFPEGIRLLEAAELLEENGVCDADEFLQIFNSENNDSLDFDDLVPDDELKFYKMEGYFFPDTYDFYIGTDPEYVVEVIKLNFNKKVYNAYYTKMKEKNLTLDEVITLASIVQREAANISDMKMVASVFWNRLNNSSTFPLLQSDPTTKYVNEIIKPNISMGNEEMYTAYDSYKGKGLPPGAICNPGIDAILAVLEPSTSNYYYFCSDIDEKTFFFAQTLEQHEANLAAAGLK